jgi:hypothetical protein
LLVFNNGPGRPGGRYSSMDEIVLPADAKGNYMLKPGPAYGPDKPLWSYAAPRPSDFYSSFISGAQRLANGHTLVCSGANGTVFEVTPDREVVWRYVNPCQDRPPPDLLGLANFVQGLFYQAGGKNVPPPAPAIPSPGRGSRRRSVQILSVPFQEALKLTARQKEQVTRFEKGASAKLDKVLTDRQRRRLKEMRGGGGPSFPGPGQIVTPAEQGRLELTAGQKKQVVDLQKEADARLAAVLTDEQKEQLQRLPAGLGRGRPGGPAPVGPPGGRPLFRAYRYGATYAGLAGKKLTPGKTIEELEHTDERKQRSAPQKSP